MARMPNEGGRKKLSKKLEQRLFCVQNDMLQDLRGREQGHFSFKKKRSLGVSFQPTRAYIQRSVTK